MYSIVILAKNQKVVSHLVKQINECLIWYQIEYRITSVSTYSDIFYMVTAPDLIIDKRMTQETYICRQSINERFSSAKFIYLSDDLEMLMKNMDTSVIGFCLLDNLDLMFKTELNKWAQLIMNKRERFVYEKCKVKYSIPYHEVKLILYENRRVKLITFNNEEIDIGIRNFNQTINQFCNKSFVKINSYCGINLKAIKAIEKDWILVKDSNLMFKITHGQVRVVKEKLIL